MPETKKYLNRDGLEKYNSLLPHSSAEIQEYVDDWLDAHPEATTTVQDGSITTQKLADGSVTRNKLAADVAHLLGGMMVTGEVQGEILSADDAYSAAPLSMEIDGKSTQNGTPTPDAPVPIDSIEVLELPVTFAGKNLLNLEAMVSGYRTNQNGNVISASNFKVSDYIAVTPNTSFYVYHAVGSSYGYGVWQYTADKTPISYFNSSGITTNLTFITNANCQYLRISTYLDNTDCYLVLGTAPISYEPYSGITANIPMQGHVLRSLPDGTCDAMTLSYLRESDRAGWAWYSGELVQRINAAVFNETYNWSRDSGTEISDGTWQFECNIGNKGQPVSTWSNTNTAVPAYCDHLKAAPTGALYSGWVNSFGIYQYRLYVRMSGITTLNELKTWIAQTPLTIQYPITPITTQLDPVELPILPAPNCTVWSDPTTGLKMSYMRDANIVISDIEQAIADL